MSLCKKRINNMVNNNINIAKSQNKCSCNCMNKSDLNKYDYVYKIKSGKIANECLNVASIDERHMNRFAKCIDIVTENNCDPKNTKILGLTFDDMRFNPYNIPVCKYNDLSKCYEN